MAEQPVDEKAGGGPEAGAGADGAAPDEELPDALEAVRQLYSQAPHLWARSVNVMRDAAVSGDMVGGDKNVGLHFHGAVAAQHVVGPVPFRERRSLARVFAASRRYDEALRRLERDRVLVLRGVPDSGRRMAGLRLLHQVCGERRPVVCVDPAADPVTLRGLLRAGHGHLQCDPLNVRGELRDVHLHAAGDQLRELGEGYLVITVDAGTVVDGADPVEWEAPRAEDVVRAHLAQPSGTAVAGAELLALQEVRSFLSGRPTPREAAGFARLLALYGRQEVDAEQLAHYGRAARRSTLEQWFSPGGGQLREQAFLLSLSVFDGFGYPLISESGDALYRMLRQVEAPDASPVVEVFGVSRAARMKAARAYEPVSSEVDRWGAPKPPGLAFQDTEMWSAVLAHVWAEHPVVRRSLVAWLQELGRSVRGEVRVRAAVAVGTLACSDFAEVYDRFLVPWSGAERLADRQLAAWALVAAVEGGAGTAVHRLLREWCRSGGERRRWTAIRAHAVLGNRAPGAAMRDLGAVVDRGIDPDTALARAVVQTLETLLVGGASAAVLVELAEWLSASSRKDLALTAFLRAISHVDEVSAGGLALSSWLAAPSEDPRLRRALVALWRRALGHRETQRAALRVLGWWVRAAQTSPSEERALADLLPALAGTDMERGRLDHLLRKTVDEEGRILPVAQRLRAVLDGAATASKSLVPSCVKESQKW
ncbi:MULTISPECIES: hypothetical protein [unclassified Streptomyces]|uniref:hypothetical protein n=1 Tax=unclassified Streptomyces TaxID=2593676 RepID=UPI00039E9DF6|nr:MULTISPECIES: hypothetical protein [unclassified Streptomyces]MYT27911.1 hypothetical protein [Streptomyces sp. SID8354]